MNLEYIFPDHTKRNHNIAIAVEVTFAVFGLILIFWAISHYWVSPKEVVEVSVEDSLIEQRNTLSKPGPDVIISPEQLSNMQSVLGKPGPTVQQKVNRTSAIQNI